MRTDRREHKRYVLPEKTLATIYPIMKDAKQAKTVQLIEMSATGLQFISKHPFAANFVNLYRFVTLIKGKKVQLEGRIVRVQRAGDYYVCGVRFNFLENPS